FHCHILLPPVSALFPYTTLFRSCLPYPPARCPWYFPGYWIAVFCFSRGAPLARRFLYRDSFARQHLQRASKPKLGLSVDQFPRRDRKSTRLNSSHVSISYAVFCL